MYVICKRYSTDPFVTHHTAYLYMYLRAQASIILHVVGTRRESSLGVRIN